MKNLKFGARLTIGFTILIIISSAIVALALIQINTISNDTKTIYEHPLVVSNAVRDIEININAIHRSMKDVALSENYEQLNTNINLVNHYDSLVHKAFGIVEERFLGDMNIEKDAHKTYSDWEIIRNEVIELHRSGQKQEAIDITRGKGAEHVKLLFEKTKLLSDFAKNKGDELYNRIVDERHSSKIMLIIIILVLITLSIVISIIISRSISKPIRNFVADILPIFRKEHIDEKELDSKSEIEILSLTAKELKNAYGHLNNFNKELEEKVNERTVELQKKNEEYALLNEEYLSQNEEIKAANEELRKKNEEYASLNEEYLSQNEEIKASNEELNNKNEELIVVKEKIEESEEKYRGLYNSIRDAIIVADVNRNIIDCNPAFNSMFGYSVEDIQGKQTKYIYNSESEFLELGNELKEHFGEEPFLKTVTYKKKSGETFPGETNLFYLKDDNGNVTGFIGLIRDITERKLAEDKLKTSENELKKAQEISHVGSWYLDIKTNEVVWTEELYKMYGFDPAKPVPPYTEHMKLFTPESWELLSTSLENTTKTGIPYELELKTVKSDGSNGWMWVRGEAVKDEKNNIIGLWGAAQDISERKQTEENLRLAKQKSEEAEARLLSILENSPTGFAINKISTGQVIYVNKTFADAYHIPIELCKTVESFFHYVYGDQMELGTKILEDVKSKDPERMQWESVPVTDKKTKKVYYVNARNILLEEQDLMISSVWDITDSVESKEKLKIALKQAQEADQIKSAFLATMSHELRTPLNAIIGFSEMLAEDFDDEEVNSLSKIINSSGNHLLSIVEDLFDVTLIEAGEVKIDKKDFHLLDTLHEVNSILETEQRKTNKENIPINLISEPDANFIINSDPSRLKQILINLLKNALKFTHKGQINYGYSVEEEKGKTMLKFFVEDSGIGIPKDRQANIFEIFNRVDDSMSSTYGGTGIGLSISKKLSTMMGGEIWVESTEGKGSTFYFTIEIGKEKTIDNSDKNESIHASKIQGKTILIVEDVEISYQFLQIILEKSGVDTLWASDGVEAVKYCKENSNIDLVLMDINMPNMNGYEATIKIKEFRPELPIIAQTAYAIAGDKEKIINAGCDDYITKPVNRELLIEKINKLIK